jgi:hypothetical protein
MLLPVKYPELVRVFKEARHCPFKILLILVSLRKKKTKIYKLAEKIAVVCVVNQ